MSDTVEVAGQTLKVASLKQTWDDDCEQIVIEHPLSTDHLPQVPKHVHHKREVIISKTKNSVTIEPMMIHPPGAQPYAFNERLTYNRTADKDAHGRAIFRQGV
jgi:hypothetical protein